MIAEPRGAMEDVSDDCPESPVARWPGFIEGLASGCYDAYDDNAVPGRLPTVDVRR